MERDEDEGELVFDIGTGTFWITRGDVATDQIQFGDEFEVRTDGGWARTKIEITDDGAGNLLFKLRGTPYEGILDGIPARALPRE